MAERTFRLSGEYDMLNASELEVSLLRFAHRDVTVRSRSMPSGSGSSTHPASEHCSACAKRWRAMVAHFAS